MSSTLATIRLCTTITLHYVYWTRHPWIQLCTNQPHTASIVHDRLGTVQLHIDTTVHPYHAGSYIKSYTGSYAGIRTGLHGICGQGTHIGSRKSVSIGTHTETCTPHGIPCGIVFTHIVPTVPLWVPVWVIPSYFV